MGAYVATIGFALLLLSFRFGLLLDTTFLINVGFIRLLSLPLR
jgi:hypothetical protein